MFCNVVLSSLEDVLQQNLRTDRAGRARGGGAGGGGAFLEHLET